MTEGEVKALLKNWPKNPRGDNICSRGKPMPIELEKEGRWEHDDVHETDYNGDYYIEYKCNSCGHVWKSEMPD